MSMMINFLLDEQIEIIVKQETENEMIFVG